MPKFNENSLRYIKTSKASSIIEFELNFGILIKDFIESKKFMFDDFMYDINQRRKIIYQEKSVQ